MSEPKGAGVARGSKRKRKAPASVAGRSDTDNCEVVEIEETPKPEQVRAPTPETGAPEVKELKQSRKGMNEPKEVERAESSMWRDVLRIFGLTSLVVASVGEDAPKPNPVQEPASEVDESKSAPVNEPTSQTDDPEVNEQKHFRKGTNEPKEVEQPGSSMWRNALRIFGLTSLVVASVGEEAPKPAPVQKSTPVVDESKSEPVRAATTETDAPEVKALKDFRKGVRRQFGALLFWAAVAAGGTLFFVWQFRQAFSTSTRGFMSQIEIPLDPSAVVASVAALLALIAMIYIPITLSRIQEGPPRDAIASEWVYWQVFLCRLLSLASLVIAILGCAGPDPGKHLASSAAVVILAVAGVAIVAIGFQPEPSRASLQIALESEKSLQRQYAVSIERLTEFARVEKWNHSTECRKFWSRIWASSWVSLVSLGCALVASIVLQHLRVLDFRPSSTLGTVVAAFVLILVVLPLETWLLSDLWAQIQIARAARDWVAPVALFPQFLILVFIAGAATVLFGEYRESAFLVVLLSTEFLVPVFLLVRKYGPHRLSLIRALLEIEKRKKVVGKNIVKLATSVEDD